VTGDSEKRFLAHVSEKQAKMITVAVSWVKLSCMTSNDRMKYLKGANGRRLHSVFIGHLYLADIALSTQFSDKVIGKNITPEMEPL
jgi:hypothetical protein